MLSNLGNTESYAALILESSQCPDVELLNARTLNINYKENNK